MSAAATGRAPPVGLREFGGGDEEAGRKASEGTVSAVPGLSGLAMSASASGAVSVGDAAATEGAGSSSSSSQSQSIAIRNHHNHYNQQHQHHHNRKNSFASLSPSLPPHAGGSVAASSFRRARALLDNLSRSIVSNNGFSSPLLGPNVSTASLAKSVSRSLGKSWTREAFLDTLAMHLDPKSPLLAASPQRDLDQFANLEDRFCRDFSCCGIALASMHDLLQHFEEFHVLVESDYDDDVDFEDEDEDEDYEEHFPFEIDDSMDMDEFDIVSVQQQQEFNTAFLKAQIASINNNTPTTMSAGPSVSDPRFILQQQQHQQHQQQQEQQHVTRATISSLLGNTSRTPSNTSTFSQIQRYDNQVDVFRIMPPQRSHSEAVPSPSAFNPFPLPQRTASAYTPGPAASHDAPPSAFNDTVIRKRTVSSINSNINNSVHSSNPGTPVAPAASAGATRRRRASASYDVDTPPALLPFCTDATPTHVYHEDESMGECEDTDMAESFVSTSASGAAVGMAHHRAPASDYGGDDLSEVIPVPGSAGLSGEGSSATGVPSTSRGGAARGGAGGIGATGDERPFKCKVERCGKEYKNPNGLKYHMRNGHGQDTGNPEVDVLVNKPYQCVVDGCGKRYKNLNGLKYHIQHAHVELLESSANANSGMSSAEGDME